MKYKIKVEDQEFFLLEKDATTLNLAEINSNDFHIIKDHQNFHLQVLNQNGKDFEIKVNGNIYNLSITDEKDDLIEKMGLSIGQTLKLSDIKAPMPGLILNTNVEIGQEIKEGDELLVLEAMKMENVITADGHGIVKEILINRGDAVDKGQILIKME